MPTFVKAAEAVITIHAENWKPGSRFEEGWRSSLRDYAMPTLAGKRVDAVTAADVMAVLLPIWSSKREAARRLRHRIGAVMKWAVAQGYRQDNPVGDAISAALPRAGGLSPQGGNGGALPEREGRSVVHRSIAMTASLIGCATDFAMPLAAG